MPKAINSDQTKCVGGGICCNIYGEMLRRGWQESFDLLVTTCLKKGRDFYGQIDIFYAFLKTEHFCTFEKLFTDVFNPMVNTEERGTGYHSELFMI